MVLLVLAASGAGAADPPSSVTGPFAAGREHGEALTRCMDAVMPGRNTPGQSVSFTDATSAALKSCMRANGFDYDYTPGAQPSAEAPAAAPVLPAQATVASPAAVPDKPVAAKVEASPVQTTSATIYAPPSAPVGGTVFVPSDKTGPTPVFLH